MEKIRLLVHRNHVTDVLREVQRHGIVEFTDLKDIENLSPASKAQAFEFEHAASKVDFAISFIERHVPQPSTLRTMLEGSFVRTDRKEMKELLTHYPYHAIAGDLEKLESRINHHTNRIKEIEDTLKALEPWGGLGNISITENGLTTAHTNTYLLEVTSEGRSRLMKALQSQGINTHALHGISETHATLTFLSSTKEQVDTLLRERSIAPIPLPPITGTIAEAIQTLKQEHDQEETFLDDAITDVKSFAPKLPKLKIVSDILHWRKEKHQLIASAHGTESVLVFEGWCPKKYVSKLRESVHDISSYSDVAIIDTDEQPPVELENNKLIQPFESVTRLYGLPGSTDLDPTVFLAGFFFIFFGLCLTDVGYGLFLALITGSLLWMYRLPKDLALMLKLLCFGGIASGLIGLFFGGYLGVDVTLLPQWAQALQTFDPIASPLPVLYLALGFGVVQIMFGLILKIIRDAKQNELLDGMLDNGPWLLLFISLGLFAAQVSFGLYLVYASLLLLVLTQGRKEKSIFAKFGKGILSLYDGVGYFSDILSYSRILALGLATTALAFAVNLIAALVNDMIPYVGTVLMVIILIVGHLFNIAVNVLGAFIHSARLQFVEFFGKFITTSGRPFKPFKQVGRYSNVE